MQKYYKLINGVWEEIQKVLAGQVETETIDDTLDNGVLIYDNNTSDLIPVFTPIKIDTQPHIKITVTDEVYLSISSDGNLFYVSESYGWSNQLNTASADDLIELTNQTDDAENQVYKVISYSYGILTMARYSNKERFFLAAEERMEQHTKIFPYVFRHTLIYIEPTKYLEKIFVYNLCLTNKTDTLKAQIEKALVNAELIEAGQNPRFSLSSDLITFLGNTPGEDFFFDKATLREILDAMLAVKNARVYIEKIDDFNDIKISYVDMNEVKETIEFAKIASTERSNNVEMHAGNIEGFGANSVIPNVVFQDWTSFKTTEAVLTSNNFKISTVFPIERIIKLEILCDFRVNDGAGKSIEKDYEYPLDLTEAVFDRDAYTLLDENYGTTPGIGFSLDGPLPSRLAFGKDNVLVYDRSGQNITGGKKTDWIIFPDNPVEQAIEAAIDRACIRYEIPGSENLDRTRNWTVTLENNVINCLVRIEYIPYIDTYTKITKPGLYDNEQAKLSAIDNQSEKVISSLRHGINLLGKISRLGNDEYIVDTVVKDHDEIKEIGQKTIDNYIIYKKEVAYHNNYAKVRYYLSKNYNNLNERIALNREKRVYDIPLTSYLNEILIKNYILVDFLPVNNSGIVKNFALRALIGRTNNTVSKFVFETKSGSDTFGPFELATANYTMGTVMHFVAQCMDNYSVGYSIGGRIIGGNKVVYNPYVDDNTGEFESFKFLLTDFRAEADNFIEQNKILPKTNYDYYISSSRSAEGEYRYLKDAYQTIKFNVALELLPAKNQFGTIIIGNRLVEHNGLIKRGITTFDDAVIYVSEQAYNTTEIFKAKGSVLSGASLTRSTVNNAVRVDYAPAIPSNKAAFAIADASGNLYLAVNDISKLKDWIYFYGSNELK